MTTYPLVFEDGIVDIPDVNTIYGGGYTSVPSVVVGTRPWDDNSDATYAVSDVHAGSSASVPGVQVQPFSLPGELTNFEIRLRASRTGDTFSHQAIVSLAAGSEVGRLFLSLTLEDEDIHDYAATFSASDAGFNIPSAVAAGDLRVYVGSQNFATHHTVTTYQLEVDLVTADVAPTEPPVTRLYPRKDGRGLSSAPRLVGDLPPGRLVGGYT